MSTYLLKLWSIVPYLVLATAFFNLVARRLVKEETIKRWDKDRPRLANFFRFFRAGGSDLDKAFRALYCFITGKPWPKFFDAIFPPTPEPPTPTPTPSATPSA